MSSDTVRSFSGILYFFSECNFHFFLHWSSSDTLLSSDWVLGLTHSYAICTYETRYWAQPFLMQFEHTRQLAPTVPKHDYFYTHDCCSSISCHCAHSLISYGMYLLFKNEKGEIGKVIINLKIPLFFLFLFFK